ncbi:tripartite tricarboxylate transporter permease [Thermodesulfobacteriota bacterium]
MIEAIGVAFEEILTIKILLMILAGLVGGLVTGSLPGLTATMEVALLVPFNFAMSSTEGLIVLGAIYMACIYGGAFSAILVNTPGTPSSIGTTFDGFPMAKRGEGERAGLIATFASVYGGIVGIIFLLFLSPPLVSVALKFGPPEYFWMAMFGITIISSLSSRNILKGFIGGAIGILIGTVGIAPIGGDVRFTVGIPELQGGIELIVALIGFFCIPEALTMIGQRARKFHLAETRRQSGIFLRTFKEVMKKQGNLLRSSIVGTFVGILPGVGGSVANLVAYNEVVRISKHPDSFGTGIPDGIIATEASNNAVVGGGMVTLGIPGAPPDAILYGVLLIHGLRPGPELFSMHSGIIFTFIISLFVATILMVPIGVLGGRILHRTVVRIPIRFLAPVIFFLTIIGSYSIRNNLTDVIIMLSLGVLGYVLKRFGFHPGPITLGVILGPIGEMGFVQALLMGLVLPNKWMIFFNHPLSWILIIMSILSLSMPLLAKRLARSWKIKEM